MRVFSLILVFCLATAVFAEERSGKFHPLFDGKSLTGWVAKTEDGKPAEQEFWSVVDGVLTARPGAGWLSTEKMYANFALRLEWRIPENGNSGVFIRVPEMKTGERPHIAGIEIQVLDDKGPQYAGKLKPWQFSGSIYGAVPATNTSYQGPGKWHAYEIACAGDSIKVQMNGQLVTSANMAEQAELKTRPRRGYIGLQNHGSGVEYRKIEILEIE